LRRISFRLQDFHHPWLTPLTPTSI